MPTTAKPAAKDAEAGTAQAQAQPPAPSVRERIIAAATELFTAEAIRAVSADRVIAAAGITKVTFYRYFRTKDDLVVAYLEERATLERTAIGGARRAAPDDAAAVFRMVAEGIGQESCVPGFRGCPFINAAAEYRDPEHPVRRLVEHHRQWFRQSIEELLVQLDVPEAPAVADELMMLRDGAMVSGYLSDPQTVARSLQRAGRAVIGFAQKSAQKSARTPG
jgi:AcrR family transcriptional regulator